MSKTVKSVNLEAENKKLIDEIFHEFKFPNFSQAVNAILTAIRVNPEIIKEIKATFMRGPKHV